MGNIELKRLAPLILALGASWPASAAVTLASTAAVTLASTAVGQRDEPGRLGGCPGLRRSIVDRNGTVLAASACATSLFADPKEIQDPAAAAAELARLIPASDERLLRARLTSNHRFVWLGRRVPAEAAAEVMRLGWRGIGVRREAVRSYPFGSAAALVGFDSDDEHTGLSGAERYFDATLREPGPPVQLALDVRVQLALHEQLANAVKAYRAAGAAALVLDVHSAEILGLVSLPDFDPNERGRLDLGTVGNKAVSSAYEPGGVFEIFNAALAIDRGRITPSTSIDVAHSLRLASYTVADDEPANGPLSVADIIARSSVVGAVHIARLSTPDEQQAFFRRLHLLDPLPIELGEMSARPLYPRPPWGALTAETLGYGYGIAVSPLQVAAAASALINGGRWIAPTLLKRSSFDAPAGERVVTEATSASMRTLLRHAVQAGTGQSADVSGYSVGGKTGTALRVVAGSYDRSRRVTWFFAAFPMDSAPRYATLVMLEEPQAVAGGATAQWNAAPASALLTARLAPLLGIAGTSAK